MKFIKNYNSFINENKTFTAGLYPHFEDDSTIYIEEVHENGDVDAFELKSSISQVMDWFIDEYGRDASENAYDSDGEHYIKEWDLSDEEVESIIENDDRYLKKFCLSKRNEWKKIEE
jgi:hypothetical protein